MDMPISQRSQFLRSGHTTPSSAPAAPTQRARRPARVMPRTATAMTSVTVGVNFRPALPVLAYRTTAPAAAATPSLPAAATGRLTTGDCRAVCGAVFAWARGWRVWMIGSGAVSSRVRGRRGYVAQRPATRRIHSTTSDIG